MTAATQALTLADLRAHAQALAPLLPGFVLPPERPDDWRTMLASPTATIYFHAPTYPASARGRIVASADPTYPAPTAAIPESARDAFRVAVAQARRGVPDRNRRITYAAGTSPATVARRILADLVPSATTAAHAGTLAAAQHMARGADMARAAVQVESAMGSALSYRRNGQSAANGIIWRLLADGAPLYGQVETHPGENITLSVQLSGIPLARLPQLREALAALAVPVQDGD
jgi:hypothetical protein